MKNVNATYRKLLEIIEPRSFREKGLILITGLVVLYLAFDALFFSPLYHRYQVTKGFIYEKSEILKALNDEQKVNLNVSMKEDIEKFEAKLQKSDLIFPEDTLATLKALIIAEPSISIESLSTDMTKETEQVSQALPYHLILRGGFFDIQSFLKKLEHIATIEFLSMTYKVDEHPNGVLELVFTVRTPESKGQES